MPETSWWYRRSWLRWLVVIALGLGIFLWLWWRQPTTTVLLIRHAEPAALPAGDPVLSSAGQTRAQTLVHVAGSAGIQAIFASHLQRTQQTVAPLATNLGLTAEILPASDVDELVDRILSSHRGEVVLVAGHSDTLPLIVERLGGGVIAPIGSTEFDNLFVLTRSWCRKRLVRLKYGSPS